jgi:hypothetical protein
MLLEATTDVERPARLNRAHHGQYVPAGDRSEASAPQRRKGVALVPDNPTPLMAGASDDVMFGFLLEGDRRVPGGVEAESPGQPEWGEISAYDYALSQHHLDYWV